MAKQKKKPKKKYHKPSDPIMGQSDIPFVLRSQYKHQAKVNHWREYSARVVLYGMSIALHRVKNVGYRRLIRFSQVYEQNENEIYEDGVEVGLVKAKKRMDEMRLGISGELYAVPDVGGTIRDQDVANQSSEATQVALTAAAITMNDVFGYGETVQIQIHDEFSAVMAEYGKAGKGMKYLLDEMKKIGFAIVNGKAVFYLDEEGKTLTPGQTKKLLGAAKGQA